MNFDFVENMSKSVTLMIAVVIFAILAIVLIDSARLQGTGIAMFVCKFSSSVESKSCQKLPGLGIDPAMARSDSEYFQGIQDRLRNRILNNSELAQDLAQYTVDHAGSRGVKLTVEVLERFEQLSGEDV